MATLQPVRGTQDLLPAEQARHRRVSETARLIAERYGYQEIATPIFEFTEVFSRPIGETTDIVASATAAATRSRSGPNTPPASCARSSPMVSLRACR
jgi:histidyl-tRNA synthetase